MRTRTPPLLTLVLAALVWLTGPAQAASSDSIPVALPAPERVFDGYDWESRVNHTHVVRDALALSSEINLGEVWTPYIDLELEGLMPYRTFHLTGGSAVRERGYADASGRAVFWSLPAKPGTRMVTDGVSGEPVTTIVIQPGSGTASEGSAYKSCHWHCPTRLRPPQPTHTDDLEQGLVIEQAAYSFTPYAAVRVENCWSHRVTVVAKATAGIAGNGATAGADRSYTRTSCESFGSAGTPTEYRRYNDFRKDTYEDGSYKIYALRDSDSVRVLPRADLYFPPPEDAVDRTVGAVSGGPYVLTVEEANAGGIRYGVGVEAYGTGLAVEFYSSGESATRVSITFEPPSEGTRQFKYKFYNGDQVTTGIVAAVWLVVSDCSPGCPP